MRVVLDANVWVSAATQNGPAHRILQRWLAGNGGFDVILCPTLIAEAAEVLIRRPRMRKWIDLAVAERWIGTLRRELLDRTIIWNQRQLERLVADYIDHYNTHRPHCSLDQRPHSETTRR